MVLTYAASVAAIVSAVVAVATFAIKLIEIKKKNDR